MYSDDITVRYPRTGDYTDAWSSESCCIPDPKQMGPECSSPPKPEHLTNPRCKAHGPAKCEVGWPALWKGFDLMTGQVSCDWTWCLRNFAIP